MSTGLETASFGLTIYQEFKGDILIKYKEFKFLFEKGLSEYIESYRKKYVKTNTFLFRDDKINFYDTYFPLTLSNGKNNEKIDINGLFKESSCIAVIGNAGSGKTMILRHLFLECLETLYTANRMDEFNKVPIVIELRFLNKFNGSLEDYIKEKIFDNNLSPSSRHFTNNLKSGNFIFLLDGFDELSNDKREAVILNLDKLIDKYSKNLFFLTSRPGLDVEMMPRFEVRQVNKLSKSEIRDFIKMQFKNVDEEVNIDNIIIEVEKAENTDLRQYLSTPLLLSMFLLTYKLYPNLPKTKSKFYENVFDTLTTRHDSLTKEWGYWRDRKTGLDNFEIKDILKLFSYKSFFDDEIGSFKKQYIFKIFDLIKKENPTYKFSNSDLLFDLSTSISILIKDGEVYSFPHRSLQEYFAALLISEQNVNVASKIYNEKIINGFDNREVGALLSLLKEIDEINFIDFIILGFSNRFLEKVHSNDTEILIDNIIDYYSSIYSSISTNRKGEVYYVSDRDIVSLLRYIFDFVKSENFLDIVYFAKLLQLLANNKNYIDNRTAGLKEAEFFVEVLNVKAIILTENTIEININNHNVSALKQIVKKNKKIANDLYKKYNIYAKIIKNLERDIIRRNKINETLLGV